MFPFILICILKTLFGVGIIVFHIIDSIPPGIQTMIYEDLPVKTNNLQQQFNRQKKNPQKTTKTPTKNTQTTTNKNNNMNYIYIYKVKFKSEIYVY